MFLFTHIEKCAGTSFNEILSLTFPRYFHITKNNYGGNETRNDLTLEQYTKILKYIPSGVRGHSVRPYLDFLPLEKRITFLRNPLDRYLSQYNHMIERGWTSSIEVFLNTEFYNNFMTKKIGGVTSDYRSAETILSRFEFIGNADEYNKSLNYLQDVLNVQLVGTLEAKNIRRDRQNYMSYVDLSEAQKLKVEENNRLDIKLYDKFITQNNAYNLYSDAVRLKEPSKLRIKVIRKLDKYKKNKIINPIRLI